MGFKIGIPRNINEINYVNVMRYELLMFNVAVTNPERQQRPANLIKHEPELVIWA